MLLLDWWIACHFLRWVWSAYLSWISLIGELCIVRLIIPVFSIGVYFGIKKANTKVHYRRQSLLMPYFLIAVQIIQTYTIAYLNLLILYLNICQSNLAFFLPIFDLHLTFSLYWRCVQQWPFISMCRSVACMRDNITNAPYCKSQSWMKIWYAS
jgi:hypothetical protein